MRTKKKDGKIISLNLDEKEIILMNFDKEREGIKSNSEYVGWLIRLRNQSTNPAEFLKELQREEEDLTQKISKIKNKRSEAIRNLELNKEIENAKQKKRPEAIKILQRKIIEEGILIAEQTAKTWAMILTCTPTELLFEAMRNIQKESQNEIKKL
jgi:hypothetical protein